MVHGGAKTNDGARTQEENRHIIHGTGHTAVISVDVLPQVCSGPRKSLLDRLGVYPVLLDCLLYRVRHCIGFYDCLLDHNQKVSSDKFDVIETTRNSIWRFTQPETGKIRGPSATNQPDERGLAAPTPPVEPTLARTRPSRPAPFFASTLYIFIHLAGYNRTNM